MTKWTGCLISHLYLAYDCDKLIKICRICNILPKLESLADLHVANEFLKVLKHVACNYKDWNAIMAYFYETFREMNGNQKNFKRFYQVFHSKFTRKNFITCYRCESRSLTSESEIIKSSYVHTHVLCMFY